MGETKKCSCDLGKMYFGVWNGGGSEGEVIESDSLLEVVLDAIKVDIEENQTDISDYYVIKGERLDLKLSITVEID